MLLNGFKGLRNMQQPERLAPGCLSDCANVFLDDTGELQSVPGFTKTQDFGGSTGADMWTMEHLRYLLVKIGGALYARWPNNAVKTLTSGLVDDHYRWASAADNAWYAGPTEAGWIVEGSRWQPLRLPSPSIPAASMSYAGPTLYQFQVARVLEHIDSGLQSGASPAYAVTGDGAFSTFYADPPPAGYRSHFYITEPNGTVLKWAGSSQGEAVNVDFTRLGHALDPRQENAYSLPIGEVVGLGWWNGRLYAAYYDASTEISTVYASQLHAPHLYKPDTDAFSVSGRIFQMAGVSGGLLIATDRSVVVLRATEEGPAQPDKILDYGCVGPNPIAVDSFGHVVVATQRGAATFAPERGLASGHLKYSWALGDWASVHWVQVGGMSQAIVFTNNTGASFNSI